MYRHTHLACIVSSQNIAEITGRYYKVHRIAVLDPLLFQQSGVGIAIIDDLRNQTADIDRVGRGELVSLLCHALLHSRISEDLLYAGLGIIEVAVDTDNAGVVTLLGHHLLLLDGGDAILRIKNDDLGAGHICEACQGSLAGIAAGSRKDDDLLLLMILLRCGDHQMRQDLQSHILKGNGGAMEKLHIISTVCLCKRNDLLCIKLAVISLVDAAPQLFLGIICQHQLHNFISYILIRHLRKLLHGAVKLRQLYRHEKTAVLCQAF